MAASEAQAEAFNPKDAKLHVFAGSPLSHLPGPHRLPRNPRLGLRARVQGAGFRV